MTGARFHTWRRHAALRAGALSAAVPVACLLLALAALLAALGWALAPVPAYADGGVNLVRIAAGSERGGSAMDVTVEPGGEVADVPTQPAGAAIDDGQLPDTVSSLAYFAVLEFDKNVSYAREGVDAGFIEDNLTRVHLLRADTGEEVPIRTRPGGSMEERQLIYVEHDGWLDPLTVYDLVVDEGVAAANGTDATTQAYLLRMTTNDVADNGLTVAQNVLLVAIPAVVAAGVAVAVVRRVRAR